MSLLIRNGRIITATDDYAADIYCAGERISRIEQRIDPADVPGSEVIDAAGHYVFPGFIDPHVHVHLPFMGTHAKDDWQSISRAALIGGTTTLIEMVCPARSDEPRDAIDLWRDKAGGRAACDYSFHMGITRYDGAAEEQLRKIVDDGVTSFKVFLAYKGAFGITDEELFRTLRLAKELGVIVTAHCENETLVDELQRQLIAEGKSGPEYHEPSRPPQVEAEGVNHLMSFAELTGAHVYCVHTSCAEAVEEARRAMARGVHAWVEAVIPHLVLDRSYAERSEFEGAKYIMSPPLREKRHQDALWNALRSRVISTVGTDHAPFDFEVQKEMGRADFTKIPNGIPSVEHRIELLYTHGVGAGRIDLNTFVQCASTQPARIFGLTGKGSIAVGSDADLCIFDPEATGTISASTHHMRTDYSGFEGLEVKGRVQTVTLRGQVAVRDGDLVERLPSGKLVIREPTHR